MFLSKDLPTPTLHYLAYYQQNPIFRKKEEDFYIFLLLLITQ